jgi:hypothetical protein
MSEYDLISKKEVTSELIKWGLVFLVVSAVLGFVGSYLGVFGKALTAPSRVINKTLDTNNIIHNYEWFFDVNAAYTSRLGQIKTQKAWLSDSKGDETNRLRIELGAMQQTCRDLATKYNANSEKMNTSVFKGWSLPDSLSMSSCE